MHSPKEKTLSSLMCHGRHIGFKARRHVLDTQLFTNCLCDSSPLSLGFLICKRGIQKLIYLVVVKIKFGKTYEQS